MSSWILRLTICFLLSSNLFGQGELRFQNYTINDGLSQSSVLCVLQDDINTIWVGTQDGLNRYDGHGFEIYTAKETKGLNSDYIRCAVKGTGGILWFGTNNGLTRFDTNKESFETFTTDNYGSFSVIDIAIAKDGTVWLTTMDLGLFVFDPKTKKLKSQFYNIPSKKTTNLFVDENNNVIVASEDKGVFVLNRTTGKVNSKQLVDQDNVIQINNIRDWEGNRVLLATSRGVFTLNVSDFSIENQLKGQDQFTRSISVSDVLYNEKNEWVIATKGDGLLLIEKNIKRQFTEDLFQKNALLINELTNLFKDNSGNIWIGSQRGLSCFDPRYNGILGFGPSGSESKGIPSPNVWSFAETASRRYTFIGTDRSISRWDRTTGQYRQFYRTKEESSVGTGEMAVLSIYVISDDHLLVACSDGFFDLRIGSTDYKYTQIQKKGTEVSLLHKRAYSIIAWKGTKCFVTTKDGVLLYDYQTGKTETFVHDPKRKEQTISEGVCRLVYKDSKGRIWFATSSGGLNVLKVDGEDLSIVPFKYNNDLLKVNTNYITSLHLDKEGNLWMGTLGSGLIKWNESTKKFSVINSSNGLPNDVIYGVVAGQKTDLWLSTNKGLCSYDPKTGRVKVFTEQQGLMSNEFNLGAFMKSKSGYLYFGGTYGFNFFNPAHLGTERGNISITFTKFKLENEWLTAGKEGSPLEVPIFKTRDLYLSYRQRSFTLKFQPSDLSNSETVNYKYHLIGSEEGEILLGSLNEIHFNSLAPGDYELLIYARRGNGKWSKVPARMNIHISMPFWRTWWFVLIVAITLAFLIRLFIRRRIGAARRDQASLEIKVRNRTKEIQLQNQKIAAQKVKIEEERNNVFEQKRLLQIEKDKTEKLLKKVIPESTAEELKKSGRARARSYKVVSVLFTDFVGFTNISDRIPATELVKKLDVYFTKFDQIIVQNNLEKIKTIGDAYMCAGGVPVRNSTNPIDTVVAAIQIQAYMMQRMHEALANGEEYWELRLGINTGDVIAGVIGSERLAYDVWGATVNMAQRMEMLGVPGKVTISGATYQYIEPYFECIFKGKAQTKSRGIIDMYEVVRIKPELSVDGEGVVPNSRFQEVVNLHLYSSINYYKAERHIMKLLDQQLAPSLHYHSVGHSRDVVTTVERLALLENVTDEALFLLKSAANYHDAGFIEQYENNEEIGARMAGEILPRYGYTAEHIEKIKELIFATRIPHKPNNKLEEIICDADLDYLGRDDFHEIADRLRLELREHGKIDSDRKWDEIQVSFLKMHKYFTKTAIETRLPKKMKHLEEVEERLKRNEYVD